MADLHHLGRGARAGGGRPTCWSGSTWPTRPAKPASTYSGGMRRRLDLAMTLVGDPRRDLPRRADHRARPAQPRGHVADRPRPGRRRRHDLPHHAVPGRGRPARRPDRRAATTAGSSPRARRTSSSGASPAGTSGCSSPTRASSNRPPRALARAVPDDDALTLRVPERRQRPRRCRPCSTGSTARRRGRRADRPHPRPRRRLPRPHRATPSTRR